MLHKIARGQEEHKFVPADKMQTTAEVNYDDVIVKKPWGYEYLVFQNDCVAIWMLHIVRKRKTSMHCHQDKRTGLVLMSGKAKFFHMEKEIELDPLDGVVIEKGAFHSTEAFNPLPIDPQSENGVWVMEIESPPAKTDLVRMKDAYGRAGDAYEGSEHMVFEPARRLQIKEPPENDIVRQKAFDGIMTVRNRPFDTECPEEDALVSVLTRDKNITTDNPYLLPGGLVSFKEFRENTAHEDLKGFVFLTIEKAEKTVKVSDYIFSYIAPLGVKEVFAVAGGCAMHLIDSLGKNDQLNYIASHHQQAAAMAAEGYARVSGRPGVVLVDSGPGATNTITGVSGAWIDSLPAIFISGQVNTDTLMKGTSLRQFGIQESDIVTLVSSITKYAVTVTDPATIKYHLEKAIHLATSGRPGPVWLDIPLDIQSELINPDELDAFTPEENNDTLTQDELKTKVSECLPLLKKAKRPVLICGYGIRLARAENEFMQLVERLSIPVISSWTSSDLIPAEHKTAIGHSGIMGDRAGNFTVQNADLLLIIGSRMSIPQVGYNYSTFAREAQKIVVDIDTAELKKKSLIPDVAVPADARMFILELLRQLDQGGLEFKEGDWLKRCQQWKEKYSVVLPEYKNNTEAVNSFHFIDRLSEKLDEDAVVVTDTGSSLICTMQAFQTKAGQRLFSSCGHGAMGFGLPGAIGACFGNNRQKTICISGDGSLQMNIQEFQTLVHHDLPVILFVLNNKGYLTIKLMQQNHFGRYVGSEGTSGVSLPDILKVAQAYGIKAVRISNQNELAGKLDTVLAEPGPFVCEIMMSENQPLIPRVSSIKRPDGTIISRPLEDLYPFLNRQEFLENMIIKPVEPLKGES